MNKSIRWCTCLLLSSFLAGCAGLVDSNEKDISEAIKNFSIETDQEVYLVGEEGALEITYAYVNEADHPIYPGSCKGLSSNNLEKLVDGEWIPAYTPVCARPGGIPPLSVESGKQLEATIQISPSIWDPNWKNASWHGGDIEGTYRVWERVYIEWDTEKYDNNTLQSEIVVSNAFEIRREP